MMMFFCFPMMECTALYQSGVHPVFFRTFRLCSVQK